MDAVIFITYNDNNKSSMENIRQKIAEIITHTHKTPFEQADEILLLFSVSGRSEQLKCVEQDNADWRSRNLGYGSNGEKVYI